MAASTKPRKRQQKTPEGQPTAPVSSSKTKAYSYIRMSTKEQLLGDSQRRQLARTREYAEKHKLELFEDFDDTGVSAFRGANEEAALGEFLKDVSDGKISPGSHLVIESMDRLTRQAVMPALALLINIVNLGIVVATLDDGMQYSAETIANQQYQLLIALAAMTRAHDESRRKSELISEAWSEKRRQLRNEGRVITSLVPAWLKVDKAQGTIAVIDDRVRIIREIFDLTCSGYGIYSIARIFNERGEKEWGKPRRNQKGYKAKKSIWRDSYIKKIIVNRAVLGEFQPNKVQIGENNKKIRIPDGEPIQDYFPQIISHAVFRDAQLAMERRRDGSRGRKGQAYSNLFTGLIRCVCGAGMRYLDKGSTSTTSKDTKFLRCSSSLSGAECTSKAYKYEIIEQLILSSLESLDIEKLLGGETYSKRLAKKKHEREMARMELESTQASIIRANKVIFSSAEAAPSSTLKMLKETEKEEGRIRAIIQSLDSQIEEMLALDDKRRKDVLDKLIQRIRHESDSESRAKARRALAGELQRMISAIVIRPQHAPEFVDPVDENWKQKIPYTGRTRLEQHLKDHGFDLAVQFRNGEQKIIDAIGGSHLKLKWDKRFMDLRRLARNAS